MTPAFDPMTHLLTGAGRKKLARRLAQEGAPLVDALLAGVNWMDGDPCAPEGHWLRAIAPLDRGAAVLTLLRLGPVEATAQARSRITRLRLSARIAGEPALLGELPSLRGLVLGAPEPSLHGTVLPGPRVADPGARIGALAGLPGMERLHELRLVGIPLPLEALGSLPSLRRLGLDGISLAELRGLRTLPAVEALHLRAVGLTSLSGIEDCPALQSLRLSNCDALMDFSALAGCAGLSSLSIHRGPEPTHGLAALQAHAGLRLLHLEALTWIHPLPVGVQLPQLRALHLRRLPHVDELPGLGGCPALRSLWLEDLPELRSIDGLESARELRQVDLRRLPALASLVPLAPHRLEGIRIQQVGQKALVSVTGLEGKPLRRLELVDMAVLESLEGLRDCDSMVELRVARCPRLRSLDGMSSLRGLRALSLRVFRPSSGEATLEAWGIAALTRLRRLDLGGTELRDLAGISALTELEHLALDGCSELRGFEGLQSLPKLRTLRLERARQVQGWNKNFRGVEAQIAASVLSALPAAIQACFALYRQHRPAPGEDPRALQNLMPHLAWFDLERWPERKLEGIEAGKNLRALGIIRCPRLEDLEGLGPAPRLRSLSLCRCARLRSLAGLPASTRLQVLTVTDCPELADLSAVQGLTRLEIVRLLGISPKADLRPLAGLPSLAELQWRGPLAPLGTLAGPSGPMSLTLEDPVELQGLHSLPFAPHLRRLSLSGRLSSLDDLGLLPRLESLRVDSRTLRKATATPLSDSLMLVDLKSTALPRALRRTWSGKDQVAKLRALLE